MTDSGERERPPLDRHEAASKADGAASPRRRRKLNTNTRKSNPRSTGKQDQLDEPDGDALPPAAQAGCIVWLVAAIAGMALLGWSWPVAVLVLVVLAGWAATRKPQLPEVVIASIIVFGATIALANFGGPLAAALSPTPSPSPSPVALATQAPTASPSPTASSTATALPTPRPTPRPARSATPRPTPPPTPRPTAAQRTPVPTPRPTSPPNTGDVETLPGLTEAMIFRAFESYDLDCGDRSFGGWFCQFTTHAGDDALLNIESSGPAEVHFAGVAISDPVSIDVPAALEVLEIIARLPYLGARPDQAADWLYANYADTGFTPAEMTVGDGHFVLRVTGDNIADLEVRARDY